MRVGILTYHNAVNYGAVLQAYALQKVISDLGAECKIINYSSPAVDMQYRRKKISECLNWKVYVLDLLSLHRLDKKKAAFKHFIDENMVLSEKIDCIAGRNLDEYDAVVVGSDQVLNPKNTNGDSSYLLNCNFNAKKITYAASIGNNAFLDLWKTRYNVDYKTLLKNFDELSFRENDASAFVSELFGKFFETVLDPVLLADTNIWQRSAEIREKYIFVYNLGNIPSMVKYVNDLHKKTGLKVYVVNKNIKGDFLYRKYENASSLSPSDFTKMLSGAEYVITDSFHGTAFSVLFHKNFYSVIDTSKANTNSRICNLLTKLNLENRILTDEKEVNMDIVSNYDEVDKKIQVMKEHSRQWLCNALGL